MNYGIAYETNLERIAQNHARGNHLVNALVVRNKASGKNAHSLKIGREDRYALVDEFLHRGLVVGYDAYILSRNKSFDFALLQNFGKHTVRYAKIGTTCLNIENVWVALHIVGNVVSATETIEVYDRLIGVISVVGGEKMERTVLKNLLSNRLETHEQ